MRWLSDFLAGLLYAGCVWGLVLAAAFALDRVVG